MLRRLPLYILLDQSGDSTIQNQINEFLRTLLRILRNDPMACETVCISVIRFGGSPNPAPVQVVSMLSVLDFDDFDFVERETNNDHTGTPVPLGEALEFVATRAREELIIRDADTPRDWKPFLFLLSVNPPTDHWKKALEVLSNRQWQTIRAINCGNADYSTLNEIVKTRRNGKIVFLGNTCIHDNLDICIHNCLDDLFDWIDFDWIEVEPDFSLEHVSRFPLPPLPTEAFTDME